MDAFEATAIIVKAAIEKNMIAVKPNPVSDYDETYIKNNNFNAERVADFVKTVYDTLTNQ